MRGRPPAEQDVAWARRHESAAEALYQLAVDLKGLYIKTGQFIGTRADIVPPAYVRSLSRLQDRVPPRPAPEVRRTIEEDLGQPVSKLFETFDDRPIAAASLAQVHRATLPGGREVAVKVQYPEVAELVRLDIRNLRTIVALVARFEPNFDYRTVVDEIARQVPLELDFVREARLTDRVRRNLAGFPGVVVPEVIQDYAAPRVLVTQYLHGARLLDARRATVAGGEDPAIARTLGDAFGHQILIDGLFQADPHPGNILLLPRGGIALLDYGLTKELPDRVRLGFARMVIAAANRDPAAIVAALRELGVHTRDDDPAGLLALMSVFFDARSATQGMQEQSQALARNPVEAIPGDLVLIGRVVGLLRGVCASLGSPLTPMQMLRPYAERALMLARESAKDQTPA